MQITIIGTGYVGLVASVGFADAGHNVICVDKDPQKIKSLQDCKPPIFEPGLEDLLKSAKSRLHFTLNLNESLKSSEIIFITVGTPETLDGNVELSEIFGIVENICQQSISKNIIVIKSTVPVGTCKKIKELIKDKGQSHEVVNNPEFLKEGAAIDDFLRPDRVVIGCDSQEVQKTMSRLYAPFVRNGHPILFMSNASAELTKYAANSFLSVKISFANELATLADAMGANIDEVRRGFTSDNRINPSFFHPGVGYGGSCFPKDVNALISIAEEKSCTMDVVKAASEVNNRQRVILVDKLMKRYGDLKNKIFALWGLAFKPRTDDVREAPSGYIIKELSKQGAHIVAYDPIANESAKKHFHGNFSLTDSPISACKEANGLLIVTEWNEFRNPDYLQMGKNLKEKIIFDGRNTLNPLEVKKHGFEYHCFGRQILFNEA